MRHIWGRAVWRVCIALLAGKRYLRRQGEGAVKSGAAVTHFGGGAALGVASRGSSHAATAGSGPSAVALRSHLGRPAGCHSLRLPPCLCSCCGCAGKRACRVGKAVKRCADQAGGPAGALATARLSRADGLTGSNHDYGWPVGCGVVGGIGHRHRHVAHQRAAAVRGGDAALQLHHSRQLQE